MGGASISNPDEPPFLTPPSYTQRQVTKAARAARLRAQVMYGGNRLFMWGQPPGFTPGATPSPGGLGGMAPPPTSAVVASVPRSSFLG